MPAAAAADFTRSQLNEALAAAGVPDATLEESTPRIFFELTDSPELTDEELAALEAAGEGVEGVGVDAPAPATSAPAPAPEEEGFIDFSDPTTEDVTATEEEGFIDFSLAPTPGPAAPTPAPKAAPKPAAPKPAAPKPAAPKAATGAATTGAGTRPKPDWMQGTAAAGRRRQVLQTAALADVGADVPTDSSDVNAIAGVCNGVGQYPARIIGFIFDSNSRWVCVSLLWAGYDRAGREIACVSCDSSTRHVAARSRSPHASRWKLKPVLKDVEGLPDVVSSPAFACCCTATCCWNCRRCCSCCCCCCCHHRCGWPLLHALVGVPSNPLRSALPLCCLAHLPYLHTCPLTACR